MNKEILSLLAIIDELSVHNCDLAIEIDKAQILANRIKEQMSTFECPTCGSAFYS